MHWKSCNSGKQEYFNKSFSVANKPLIKHKSIVLSHLWSTLFIIHNFLVLIAVPNVQHSEPGEINRQHSPNSSSSPLELTQIGEISLWSCFLNNKQNTDLISLIPNHSKCLCFFMKASLLCAVVKEKVGCVLPLHILFVCACVFLWITAQMNPQVCCLAFDLSVALSQSSFPKTTYTRKQNKENLL